MDLSSQPPSLPTCPVSLTINGQKHGLELHPWVSLLARWSSPVQRKAAITANAAPAPSSSMASGSIPA
jgi:hypothetical protein